MARQRRHLTHIAVVWLFRDGCSHRSARLENHIRDNEVRTFGSEFLQVIVSQMSVSMCLDADFTMPRRIACLA